MPEYVYALHDFAPEHDDEIPFRAGERIEVFEKDDLYGDGWWKGRNLYGKEGLFPQSYTTQHSPAIPIPPTPQSNGSVSVMSSTADLNRPLESLREEPDAVSQDPEPKAQSHDSDGVMKATLTDVQEAIEQLGRSDRDGGRSFSFASTGDDNMTDNEVDRDTDQDTEGSWHKGARHNLAEKVRATAQRNSKSDSPRPMQPPIPLELSDESDGEEENPPSLFFKSESPVHIEAKPHASSLNGRSNGDVFFAKLKEPEPVVQEADTQEIVAPVKDDSDVQTTTARRTSFPIPPVPSLPAPSPVQMFAPPPPLPPPQPQPEPRDMSALSSDVESRPPTSPVSPFSAPSGLQIPTKGDPGRLTKHPSEWTLDEVLDWARTKNFDDAICSKFTEHEITGDVLLDLDVNLLKSELEIHAFGKRMRIANAIAELRRPASPQSSSDVYRRASSQMQSAPSSAHMSISFPYSNGNGFHNVRSPILPPLLSTPHSSDFSPSPMVVGHSRQDSDLGSVSQPSMVNDQGPANGTSPYGLGFGSTAAVVAGTLGSLEPTKTVNGNSVTGLPAPSETTLGSKIVPTESATVIPTDDRGALSEGEANSTETRSKRRRMFGRSGASTNSSHDVKDTSSHNSKEIPTPATSVPASPRPNKRGSVEESATLRQPRIKRSDPGKASDRLSLFGGNFVGSLGKSRKPPPRYGGSDDTHNEKSTLSLSKLYIGSHSKKSASRISSENHFRKSDPAAREKEEKEAKEQTSILRKRTVSNADAVLPRNAIALKPGECVIEQIGEADHNGWMRKKGEHYNTWKLRYFILKGPHLYYLRSNSPSETKIKGYISIIGYKVIVDENVNPGKYGFRLIHDTEKTHYFSSDEQLTVREWMKALMKATIARDYTKPVISSCNIPTIPLAVAQTMNPAPRPPSPTARDATQKALRRENPNQLSSRDARILMGLPSPEANGAESDTAPTPPTENGTGLMLPPRPMRRTISAEDTNIDQDLIKWANDHLPHSLQVTNTSGSLYSGLALFRLAESVKGRPAEPPVPDSAFPTGPSDERLDGLFKLFDFFLDNDVKMGSVSINDIRNGNREKIMQLVRSLQSWEERRKTIARSVGRGGAHAGPFMALESNR